MAPHPENGGQKPAGRRPRVSFGLIAAIIVIGAGWFYWNGHSDKAAAPVASQAVPVSVTTAFSKDMPLYVSGLGNVQALNTVTVNSRVDGQIEKIAFTEGQNVRAGDLLVQIDPRPFQATLDQAVAKKAQDTAQLRDAQLDLDRYAKLATNDFASKQQLDSQQALVDQLKAQLQSDQAAIDNAQTQLGYASITAPIAGRTGLRQVDEGNIVHSTDTGGIVTIVQTEPIAALFSVPERYLPDLAAAVRAGTVPATAFGESNKVKLAEGTLTLIDNKVDEATGTVKIKATFPNADGSLWPGQFVNVRLLVKTLSGAVVVPSDAVLRGQKGLYVYIVKADSTVDTRAVTAGTSAGNFTVIESGLAAGERVVFSGQSRLFPNALIQAADIPADKISMAE